MLYWALHSRSVTAACAATSVDFYGIRRAAIEYGLFGNGYIWLTQAEAYPFALAASRANGTTPGADWPGLIIPVPVPTDPQSPFRQAVLDAWNSTTSFYVNTTSNSRWWDNGDRKPSDQGMSAARAPSVS